MRIDIAFNIIQGHQITDEELYYTEGEIPVFSGRNELKGYWDKSLITIDDLPCITYPTKANAGNAYVQYNIFDANNTAVLIPKNDEWRNKIDLHWFAFKLQNIFHHISTSKEGVSYLNKELIESYEIEIPKKETQLELMIQLKPTLIKINEIHSLYYKSISIQNKTLSHLYNNFQATNIPISEILDYISGNSGLTEEEIYQKILLDGIKYEVLSGSVSSDTGLGKVSKFKLNGKTIRVFDNQEGILVVRKGKAGHTTFLNKGKYTLTDDAYILYLKENCKYEILLEWLQIQYRNLFYEYSSLSDNGTWNMTGFFRNVKIDIPIIEEQLGIISEYRKLYNIQDKLLSVDKITEHLFTKIIS